MKVFLSSTQDDLISPAEREAALKEAGYDLP